VSGGRRIERINGLLQEELSRLVRAELKDPRVGVITITGVETTTDLMHAIVYVRTLGDQTPVEDAIEGLDSAEGYLRRLLGRELHLRRIPELRFVADRTIEHAQRIEALLEEARAEDGSEPAAD
jgi:ribosome-binding factor A